MSSLHFHRFAPAAVLHVAGEDAQSFLQGQFTQDLRSGGGYGLWLNQKGKVLADSHAIVVGPRDVWLVSAGSPAVVIRERLEAYIIADDVVIEDLTPRYAAVTAGGAASTAWIQANLGGSPVPTGLVAKGALVVPSRRDAAPAWDCFHPADLALSFMDGAERSAEEQERRRIRAGLPTVPKDLGPGELPNEGGLEDVAVSYTKGCYLGQEIMARLKSMGQIRRKLVRVRGAGVAPAAAAELQQNGKRVGELRSTVVDGAGWIGFALVNLTAVAAGGALTVTSVSGVGNEVMLDDTPV